MHYKRGQRGLRPIGGTSILGNGLLERVRSTSLALLGATAAVGLAIVAVALNQGWPLVAGSSVPPLPRQARAVGAATVVARAPSTGSPTGVGDDGRSRRGPSSSTHGRPAGAVVEAVAGAPTAVVVSGSQPVERSGEGHRVESKPPPTAPPEPQPAQPSPPATPVASVPTPAPTPEPSRTSEPAPAPASTAPIATSAGPPPEESSLPSWSNGGGHAYGRDEAWHDDDRGDDAD
ncbi:MAG TPA: hypothetical protein VFI09_04275 [Solirubrobacterales bacterium]|nr:hypothetical protein [Solirubrobacterales bacterium]